MKYTQGKWIALKWKKEWHIHADRETIVWFKESLKNPLISEANANLIASAPELLEACQIALDVLVIGGDIENLKHTLRDAIAKAEGR